MDGEEADKLISSSLIRSSMIEFWIVIFQKKKCIQNAQNTHKEHRHKQ